MSVLGWIIVTVVVVLVGFYLWGDHLNRHPEKLAPIRAEREEFAVERERTQFDAQLARVEAEAQRRQDAAVLEATRQAYVGVLGRLTLDGESVDSTVRDGHSAPSVRGVIDARQEGNPDWWWQAAGQA